MGITNFWKSEKSVVVTFDKEGEMEVEGHGFIGKACEEATRFIEKLLGTVTKRKIKPEAYKKDVHRNVSH
jgi:hypothetical protein